MNPNTISKAVDLPLTEHARNRMHARRFSYEDIGMVVAYGRTVRVRDAVIYAVGRKETKRFQTEGVDLSEYEGIHVVCSREGSIMTVYRNNDFRGLRPRGKYPTAA